MAQKEQAHNRPGIILLRAGQKSILCPSCFPFLNLSDYNPPAVSCQTLCVCVSGIISHTYTIQIPQKGRKELPQESLEQLWQHTTALRTMHHVFNLSGL